MPRWQAVIGLEVHAQLATRTKIFCGCPATFGAPPNENTCEVCLGHPGALPVLNARAVELAVRAAQALGATVRTTSRFARKNYFYPDLPKGYQISQFDEPLAEGGAVPIEPPDAPPREIGLIRLHLEEDAGKSIHDGLPDSDRASYIDLNRAGTPLAEIVSQPALHSPEEAYLYLQRLRSTLRATGVCDGSMERGSLRCDANVSIRPAGETALGTRTELKNLNSFRNVERALRFEIARQIELVEAGGAVEQRTLLWDAAAGRTRPMRSKEEAEDYRYFPDPDLPPLVLEPAEIDAARHALPELPAARRARLIAEHGLTPDDAQLLTLEAGIADWFEAVAREAGAAAAAKLTLNDLLRERNEAGHGDDEPIPVDPAHAAELLRLVADGRVSSTVARRDLFPAIFRERRAPGELLAELGLEQVSDEALLCDLVRRVIEEHPQQVATYRGGKTGVLGFLVGRAMKASGGAANPALLRELLERELG